MPNDWTSHGLSVGDVFKTMQLKLKPGAQKFLGVATES